MIEWILLGALGAGVAYEYLFSVPAKVRRALRRAPSIRVVDFRDGGVGKIVGIAEAAGAPLVAPLSGDVCVWYELEIAHEMMVNSWSEPVIVRGGDEIRVRDDSGTALVLLGRAVVIASEHSGRTTQPHATLSAELAAVLRGEGLLSTRGAPTRSYRIRERLLVPGTRVAVAGRGIRDVDPDPPDPRATTSPYRARGTRLILRGGRRAPLFVSDDVE